MYTIIHVNKYKILHPCNLLNCQALIYIYLKKHLWRYMVSAQQQRSVWLTPCWCIARKELLYTLRLLILLSIVLQVFLCPWPRLISYPLYSLRPPLPVTHEFSSTLPRLSHVLTPCCASQSPASSHLIPSIIFSLLTFALNHFCLPDFTL